MSSMMEKLRTAVVSNGSGKDQVPQQPGPGILVFSHSRQLRYVNRQAVELLGPVGQAVESCLGVLPLRLLELRDQIHALIEDRHKLNIWEPFELRRSVSDRGQQFHLRGIGNLDRSAVCQSRILIILDQVRSVEEGRNHAADSNMKQSEVRSTVSGFFAAA